MSPKKRRRPRIPQPLETKGAEKTLTAPPHEKTPLRERRLELGIPLFLGLAFFVLYVVTASRSVPPGDSGELITAAWTMGVAHQPGYPTFTLLSRLAGFFPVGNPAFRMNLLSAFLDAAALGILCWGILRFLRTGHDKIQTGFARLVPAAGAIAGAGLLGVSSVFWLYSTFAEVFALNNLFAAITLVLLLEWVRHPEHNKCLYLGGLFSGLAMTNQHTFVLLAPCLLILVAGGILRWRSAIKAGSIEGKSKRKDPGWRLPDIGITAGLFILGLLPYIYLPVAASADPQLNWGDPSTFSNFWQTITRSDYGTFSFTANSPQGNPGQQLYYMGRYFLQSFSAAGILLAVTGLVWFAKYRRLEGICIFLAFLFSGPVFAIFANPQLDVPLTLGVFERFYILPGIPLAFFITAGAYWLIELAVKATDKLRSATAPKLAITAGTALAAAMVIIMGAVHFPTISISNNRVVENYGKDLLEPLESEAMLIMSQDYNGSAVMYTQFVAGVRPDVVALHSELLKATWYVEQQRRQHPEITIPFKSYTEGRNNSLADLIEANIGQRPVYAAGNFNEDLSGDYDVQYWGLARRFVSKGEETDSFALMRTEYPRFSGLSFPSEVYPAKYWESVIAEQYGQTAFIIALARSQHEPQPDAADVERLYRIAILQNPINPGAYKNLGILLWRNGGSHSEIIELWEKYLQMVPDDPNRAELEQVMSGLKG
ncbi:MAG: DUF2723 domain-containing protein [Dehalococcoidales bacterium]|nr:DUF2723 domain-containing protein [Dehalococcoidales bacterium]